MLTVLAWLLLLVVAIPDIVITVELLLGLRPRPLPDPAGPTPRTVVLVPAHDEAAGIVAVLGRVMPLLPTGARVLVVADNCTDDTAALARSAGAEVTERHDATRRGKGHALAHGRAVLAADPPAVVIVLDADCVPEPDALARLAHDAIATGRPVQASYLIEPRPTASPMIQISGFAFLVKNLVRQAGLARLGVPVVLTGSGMAFPWADFVAAPLATDEIVEDLAIGIALARGGSAPCFDPAARIWTPPAGSGGTLSQRTRWEHGFVATARRVTVPLVREGLARGRFDLVWLGLHVAVPPLALLLAVNGAILPILALGWALGASALPLAIDLLLVAAIGLGVVLAWSRHGRGQVSGATLLRAPLYLLWKIPIYLRLVRGAETRWVRTDRS
jgi:cellulose synthase/poly-beta-1,6-N-acetylglucosamine synthase-like glycosyltransferase